MPLFKRKSDPISTRARELNSQITQLESQIRQLSTKLEQNEQNRGHPRVRSTAMPHGQTVRMQSAPSTAEHIFESLEKPQTEPEVETTASHYNDLGVRKYDLIGAIKRLQKHFRGPPAANPRLVNYLAAGSIKGLRPLRYEKRIARNRFIVVSIFFVCVLWGILWVIFSHK